MLTTTELLALVAGLVFAVALIGGAFYMLRWLRRRQAGGRPGSTPTPEVANDRAYNRLALARREADVLAFQGADVARARELIGLADASLRRHEHDRAYELAQSAHETLVALRRRPARAASRSPDPVFPREQVAAPSPRSSPPQVSGAALEPPSPVRLEVGVATSPADSAGRIPKNRLESQFQLRLLENDLATQPTTDGGARPSSGATGLYTQARAAFDRADYTEALRLALKGRRQLGSSVETLGPSTPAPIRSPGAASPAVPAERAASAVRCAHCGHPILEGDAFCRGCGAPQGSSSCPTCGAERRTSDAFCGKCGTRTR